MTQHAVVIVGAGPTGPTAVDPVEAAKVGVVSEVAPFLHDLDVDALAAWAAENRADGVSGADGTSRR